MFSKNEARPNYNIKVLQESFEKENRDIRIQEEYIPNPRQSVLTGKFYALHEMADLSSADPVLLDLIKDYKDRRPNEKYPEPVLESHEIGWYPPLVPLKKDDERYFHIQKKSITACIRPVSKKKIVF